MALTMVAASTEVQIVKIGGIAAVSWMASPGGACSRLNPIDRQANRPMKAIGTARLYASPETTTRAMILVGLPVYTVEVLGMPAWLAGALYGLYTAIIALGQTSLIQRLEHYRRTRALILAASIWSASFVLFAGTQLLPLGTAEIYLFAVTALYTVAVMLHVGVADAMVVEAAPAALRGRYVAVYQLSWTLSHALSPGLFTLLLAWAPPAPWLILALLALAGLAGVRAVEPRLSDETVRVRPAVVPATSAEVSGSQ